MARANYFGHSQVIIGDRTTHGGVVLTGSETNTWHGVGVARKGDKTYCPRCKPHFFEIAEGLANCTDTDAALPMAVSGHRTSCGALLIAENVSNHYLEKIQNFMNSTGFDDKYVINDSDGQPLAYTYYAAKLASGEIEYGTTDAEGNTHLLLTGNRSEEITFYIAG